MKHLLPLFILFFGQTLFAQTTCLEILNCPPQINPTPILTVCDSTDNNQYFWNDVDGWDPLNLQKNLGEKAFDLNIQVKNACGPAHIEARIYFDLIGDDTFETVWSSNNPAPNAGQIYLGNIDEPGFGGSFFYEFDKRAVAPEQKWQFKVVTTVSGDTTTASIRWENPANPGVYVVPELPLGLIRVAWMVADTEGNLDSCFQLYRLKDCLPPAISCQPASAYISQTLQAQLWTSDLLWIIQDNLSPNPLPMSLRRVGDGTGFPTNASGEPVSKLTFTCDDIDSGVAVELWSMDRNGNAGKCTTTVYVQDNEHYCHPIIQNDSIWVCINRWCDGAPVVTGNLQLVGAHPALPPIGLFMSDTVLNAQSCVLFDAHAIPVAPIYHLTTTLNTNHVNGVDLVDLILVSRHIQGLQPLVSPYAMIAADANKSGSITNDDVTATINLLQGHYDEFPNNTSWRFVDAEYVFPNPQNPFQPAFPESAILYSADPTLDFTAIKIGDVDCTGYPGFQSAGDDRSTLKMTMNDVVMMPNEIASVNLNSTDAFKWLGLQANWAFDTAQLEVITVESQTLSNFNSPNWFQNNGSLRVLWFDVSGVNLPAQAPVLRFILRAKTALHLSDVFVLGNYSDNLAIDSMLQGNDVVLEYLQSSATSQPTIADKIFDAKPNPTTGSAQIPVEISANEKVSVELYDQTGRLMWRRDETLGAGKHLLDIPANAMPAAGLYLWRVQAQNLSGSGKLVRE